MLTDASAPTRRALVTQAAALALLGSTVSVHAASLGDAELLSLGREFEAAWAWQATLGEQLNNTDPLPDDHPLWLRYDKFLAETSPIVAKIEAALATTLAGLIVKARACSWTHNGEPAEPDFFAPDGQPTTDNRLGASILRDLLALSNAPAWTA